MRMGVYAAGDDQFSGSIDYFVGVNDKVLANEHDGRTVYKNIRLVVIDRRHNPAIFDQDAHDPSPFCRWQDDVLMYHSRNAAQGFLAAVTRCRPAAPGRVVSSSAFARGIGAWHRHLRDNIWGEVYRVENSWKRLRRGPSRALRQLPSRRYRGAREDCGRSVLASALSTRYRRRRPRTWGSRCRARRSATGTCSAR